MIRFILCFSTAVLFLILTLPILLIEYIIGLFNEEARAKSCQVIIKWVFSLINFFAGVKLTVRGLEKVPTNEAVLYVPNHRSVFDVLILYTLCVGQTGFVAKKETKKVPIFNVWMAFMHCQFLDRKDLRKGLKTILDSAELIKNNVSICIFPEGTRNKTDLPLQDFHDGSFKIAEKANCPVIPVCLTHTNEIFEDHLPFIKSKKVIVEFLDPIYVKDLTKEDKKKLSSTVHDLISSTYINNIKE